ncbi:MULTISPECIES: IclR family transcriptional regulator [Chromohalobacter]|uniref:Transcriptional regulator, IclR family n=2 Tax=Chromohalobacter TaxID=42054 RepID=Q1R1B0_CHRI1|nr:MULTISPECIES: IclR family transcriptional regulator [Chromohalobacter]CDQ34246.1 Kip operon repressor protein [Virgibacillus halodenitrificans]ABE57498.1 transcriptional regulator, IclR family [Chromohalobacter salexigens DSM 3043]MBZ5876389.1 IclR family transcriptional regulator [Chromohalobacter salexigens]MDO0945365.1 IclR family transcriptional regulator [Chromohalobacter salexigens]NQY45470.1 IclR family transcriptional regulator [Chromohalobacter sp.]
MADDETRKYVIPGLERGLTILMALSRSHREMSLAEIVKCVEWPKASVYRAVQTLEYMGFVRRHPSSGLYSLGVSVLRLGFEYVSSLDLVQVGQPVIESLRDRSGCSSHIVIRDGRDVIYVARVSAAGTTTHRVSVGTRLPVHRTSLGRVLLTGMSREAFERLYPDPELPDTRPGAPADREALWQLVQDDRARGYVVGESFFQLGISSIVYPLFTQEGDVAGAISIMVPVHEIPAEDRERLRGYVEDAAMTISEMLGYHDPRARRSDMP